MNTKTPKDTSIIQLEIRTDEDWDSFTKKKALWLVDVHQKWCGPCVTVHGHLKRLKIELGDECINFAAAEVDEIEHFKDETTFRLGCEPLWLLYSDGECLGQMRGANTPLLTKLLTRAVQAAMKQSTSETNPRKTVQQLLQDDAL